MNTNITSGSSAQLSTGTNNNLIIDLNHLGSTSEFRKTPVGGSNMSANSDVFIPQGSTSAAQQDVSLLESTNG